MIIRREEKLVQKEHVEKIMTSDFLCEQALFEALPGLLCYCSFIT